jgi:hypothetical protein
MGTSVHKVLEVLANCKRQMQEVPDTTVFLFKDVELGQLEWRADDFLKPYHLSDEEVDTINKTRINKSTYKHECKLPYGHIRYGVELVECLIKKSQQYYAVDWAPVDYKDTTNFVWMAIDHNNGLFDPRHRNIVDAEPHFDFLIDKEWAKYDWVLPNNKEISGKLGIKGTIDLITALPGGILEIVDWKTGQRLDWASQQDNKVKTYSDLQQDFQLMLYYYAAHRMYPEAKQIIVTIFFIRDGGPFTFCFDDRTIEEVENRLRDRYNEIKACEHPTMQDPSQSNFKCKYICDYFKMSSPDKEKNFCRFIHEQINECGIDAVTNLYTAKDFCIGHYEAPGEV